MANDVSQNVLVLTPVKNASPYLGRYFSLLESLAYPKERMAIGMLESDSDDDTFSKCKARLESMASQYRRTEVWKHDLGFKLPPGVERYDNALQVPRRTALAKSRNRLLFNALSAEDQWVLWIDVDLVGYPPTILRQLISLNLDVVQPDCVRAGDIAAGKRNPASFDLNAWRDQGRLHLHDLRTQGELVSLDTVGGSMLLVRADVHRDGLIFPAFPYGVQNAKIRPQGANFWHGEIETEGLGIMAGDMGIQCWGLTTQRTVHR